VIGRTLSHYKVLEKIGEGGMGEGYLAKETKVDRDVATRVLPATFSVAAMHSIARHKSC